MRKLWLLALGCLFLASCKDEHSDLPDGLYAEIKTSKGDIMVMLDYETTPVTVANFVSLAEGTNTFVDKRFRGKPFYDGLKWHRVEPGFVIQGGDPMGNGSGDAGYKFKDEITDLRHDSAGTLSMANSGPNTNSSQFFITHVATPHLDGKHTVFGHVIGNGMDVVNKIQVNDIITSIRIIRIGEAVKKFDAPKVFGDYFRSEADARKKADADAQTEKQAYINEHKAVIDAKKAYLDSYRPKATKTATGFSYAVVKKGTGGKLKPGQKIKVVCSGYFPDGILFWTTQADIAKAYGKLDPGQAAQNGYQPIDWSYGQRTGMIPGFIEGLDQASLGDKVIWYIPSILAYGEAGRPPIIPSNADLVFDVEILPSN